MFLFNTLLVIIKIYHYKANPMVMYYLKIVHIPNLFNLIMEFTILNILANNIN